MEKDMIYLLSFDIGRESVQVTDRRAGYEWRTVFGNRLF